MFGKPFYEFIHLHINLLASLKAWAYWWTNAYLSYLIYNAVVIKS
jgi:hypothetical protein